MALIPPPPPEKNMAQRVVVTLEDDIDGGEAAETVSFALDGVSYEIDLSEANASKLRDDLASWIGHARRAGGRKSTSTARRGGGSRGRLSADIQAAYDKAHA